MALKIGQMKAASQPAVKGEEEPKAPPAAPAAPPEAPPVDLPMEEDLPEPRMGLAKVSPEAARYFGPEYRCGSCVHFMEGMQGGECEIVAGPIDAEGVCGLFEPDAEVMAAPMEMPMEAPMVPEVPEGEI